MTQYNTVRWSERAQRHADYHRRHCLDVGEWHKMLPYAERMATKAGRKRVTVPFVEAACRFIRAERKHQEAAS